MAWQLRATRMAVVTVSAVMLLAACGSPSKHASTSSTAAGTPGSTAATTSTTDKSASDDATAMAALITLSDLPAGWTSTPQNPSSETSSENQQIVHQVASCLGVPASELDQNPPKADSPEFDSPSGNDSVDDEVDVYPTAAAAGSDFSLFSSPRTPNCLASVFSGPLRSDLTKQLQPGQTLVSVTAEDVSIPKVGTHTADVRLTFVIGQSGLEVPVNLDLIVVVTGRLETTLSITQPGTLSLGPLGVHLAQVAAGRMTD